MAVFEAVASDLTTALTIEVGTTGYRSGDGDGPGRGTITNEDILKVSDNSNVGYKLYEIDVTGTVVSVIICGEFENGTTLRPWANGVSLKADAALAVNLIPIASSEYSYAVTDAGLAAALSANVAALIVTSL